MRQRSICVVLLVSLIACDRTGLLGVDDLAFAALPPETAQLRALWMSPHDRRLLKVCVFGDGRRPYNALIDQPFQYESDPFEVKTGGYVSVPANQPLRAHFLLGTNNQPNNSGCDASAAVALSTVFGGSDVLLPDRYYTVAVIPPPVEACSSGSEPGCEFYPPPTSGGPSAACSVPERYLFEDGQFIDGKLVPGKRYVNLTDDAAMLTHIQDDGPRLPLPHASLKPPTYLPPFNGTNTVCAEYAALCWHDPTAEKGLSRCSTDLIGPYALNNVSVGDAALTIYAVGSAVLLQQPLPTLRLVLAYDVIGQ